jgi:uncharacterized membrane protein
VRDRFLWTGCAVYAALFFWLGLAKYAVHRNLVDFGIFAQTIASAFGCFCNPLEGSHWAFHFSPILYVVAMAVALVHAPGTLIALQAVAGALCAPPVYAIVRRRAGVATARWSALAVWLYPPLAGLTFGDFHENNFAPAAVAWLLAAFDAGRLGWAVVFAAVALAVKEDQALFLFCAGIGGAVVYRSDIRRRNVAIAIAGASAAIAIAFFVAIQPHAAAESAWRPQRFYAWTGADVAALLPGIGLRLGFLLLALAPLAFLPLKTRAMWLAVPALLEVLLSRMSTTFTMGTHYAGAWIGYLLVAFAAGVSALAPQRRRIALLCAIGLAVLELVVANPMHPGLNVRAVQPRDARLDAALRVLPNDASIATQEEAYTHLALDDPFARLLPEDPKTETDACLVLIDREFPGSPRLQEYGRALERAVRQGIYVPIDRNGGIELYRRVNACR